MPTINQLPLLEQASGSDQVPVYNAQNGDARRLSLNSLAEFIGQQSTPPSQGTSVYIDGTTARVTVPPGAVVVARPSAAAAVITISRVSGDAFLPQTGTGTSVSAGPFVTPTEVSVGVVNGAAWIDIGNITASGVILDGDGGVVAIVSGVDQGSAITGTGTAYTGDGYLDGWNCTVYGGVPQSVAVSEGTTAGGAVVAVFTVTGTGVYPFSPNKNSRARFTGGLYATFSGGTGSTGRAVVEPA